MLFIFRLIFVVITASVAYQISIAMFNAAPFSWINIFSIVIGTGVAVAVIWIELQYANRFVIATFTVILGLLIGFVASYLFLQALMLIPHVKILRQIFERSQTEQIQDALRVGVTFFFCYLVIVLLARTRNRFKLLIPFVELNKESDDRHLILDSSVIIDGRILSICDTNILKGVYTIPKFVLNELQLLADSVDRKKRMRGRRGIDILGELQKKTVLQIYFDTELFPHIKEVDDKLLALSQKLGGVLVTNDYNLKKIAELQGIEVINLNAVANALRPPVMPGDTINIQIIKPGEEAEQGIGYLDDGTVVIVQNAAPLIGQLVEVVVTNVLQTNMGRMVFAKASEKHP